jgi:hypothetical protein
MIERLVPSDSAWKVRFSDRAGTLQCLDRPHRLADVRVLKVASSMAIFPRPLLVLFSQARGLQARVDRRPGSRADSKNRGAVESASTAVDDGQ